MDHQGEPCFARVETLSLHLFFFVPQTGTIRALRHGEHLAHSSERSQTYCNHPNGIRENVEKAAKEIIGALETLKARPEVEPKQLGLISFCVGGFLTYTVAERYENLAAVVPFYGGGCDPTPEAVASANAPVLAMYGSQDPSIPWVCPW